MQHKRMLSFLMAGFICTSYTPETKAITTKQTILTVVSAILAPSVWQYITKKDMLERYDLEELKLSLEKLKKGEEISENSWNILQNLYYLWLDGFWGTPPKNENIKLKSADGREVVFEIGKKCCGRGIVGTLHTNNKNILTVSAWVAALWALANFNKIVNLKEGTISFSDLYSTVKDPAGAVKLLADTVVKTPVAA